MEYDMLRPMTLASFLLAGGNNCDEFRDNFNLFVNMGLDTKGVDLWGDIDFIDVVPCFRMYPHWEKWLIKNNYITPRKRYHVNQTFEIPEYEDRAYTVIKVESAPNTVGLLRVSFSTKYNSLLFFKTVQVADMESITPEEFELLTMVTLGQQRHNMVEIKLIKDRRQK